MNKFYTTLGTKKQGKKVKKKRYLKPYEYEEVKEQFRLSLRQYVRENDGKWMPEAKKNELWNMLLNAKRGM